MSNYLVLIIPVVLGFLGLQFFYWRRLKEDYAAGLLFAGSSVISFATYLGAVGGIVLSSQIDSSSVFVSENLWFWTALVGFFIGNLISYKKLNIKFYEGFEASGMGILLNIILLGIFLAIVELSVITLIYSIFLVVLFLIFYFFETRYRQFSWYKSGRVGFSGLAVFLLFFLFRIPLTLFTHGGFSMVGKVDIVLSALCAFLIGFSLYTLGEDY